MSLLAESMRGSCGEGADSWPILMLMFRRQNHCTSARPQVVRSTPRFGVPDARIWACHIAGGSSRQPAVKATAARISSQSSVAPKVGLTDGGRAESRHRTSGLRMRAPCTQIACSSSIEISVYLLTGQYAEVESNANRRTWLDVISIGRRGMMCYLYGIK
jgi:hypothetical protein